MDELAKIENEIFKIQSPEDFNVLSIKIFRFQANNNFVYKSFIDNLGINPINVKKISDIPFLPIEAFKNHEVKSGDFNPEEIFYSSGTTGQERSRHLIKKLKLYSNSYIEGFRYFYGDEKNYCTLALLPSYLDRTGSSLIFMVNDIINRSKYAESGFYKDELNDLFNTLKTNESKNIPTLLIGVSFALLDFCEKFDLPLKNTIVMETGGMKGKRKELIRKDLHAQIKHKLHINEVHSEYGMTELLSQAYSKGNGIFECPPWMKIFIRDTHDPLSFEKEGHIGGINVIDLANIYSCSFIATKDLGKVIGKNKYEILGRFDNSDIRGCNLLVESI